MKRRFIFIFLFFGAFASVAQDANEYTLNECIDYALKNNADVQNSVLDVYSAKARVGEVRSIGLPQLNATVQLTDNIRLKRLFIQGGNSFFPTPGIPPGEVVGIENPLQLRSTGDGGATLSQLLFDGSYFVGLQAASVYKELSEKSLQQTKIQTVEAITKAYYLVLINEERTALLDNNISRLDSLLRETQAMYNQGFVEKIDVSRIEVNYNNLIVEKKRFENVKQVSMLMLKFQMGMPIEEELILTQNIREFENEFRLENQEKVSYENRVEYSLLQTNHKLNRLDLKNERVKSLPQLSAFINGGFFTQHTSFINLFQHQWYPYSMYGVTLNVPIFDGLGKTYRIQQAKVNIQKTENNLKNLQNSIEFQVMQSRLTHQNNLETLEAQKRNFELAEEVTRVSRIKYQEGVGSNLEVTTAENSFKEAQTNYFNALFDLLTATVDYKVASGTLINNQ